MKKTPLLLSLIASVFLFASCGRSVVFDEKVTFQYNNWDHNNKSQIFKAHLKGSEKPYSVILELEIVGTPNVDKFFSDFIITSPNGGVTKKFVHFNLTNPKEPFIQGDSPNVKILQIIVFQKKYFSETGIYTLNVDQFSNKFDNRGIRSLRMIIEKVKEKS